MLFKNYLKYFYFIFLLFPLLAKAFIPLPTEQAFVLTAQFTNNHQLQFNWRIAPGYHLYREQLAFKLLNANPVQLAPVTLPAGILKEDNILGKYQVYQNKVTIPVNLINSQPGNYELQVSYQGCADSGFCYPPVTKQLSLIMAPNHNSVKISDAQSISATAAPAFNPPVQQDKASVLLAQHNLFVVLIGFFGFGLLLAFTPCVLPMLPILSSIIIGQGTQRTTLRSFYLSLTYVLAIALTYAVAGIIAALAGSYVQAFFQNPWIIALFSFVFVLLALSLFGLYEIRLPAGWNHLLTQLSQHQQGGTYIGVFIMGCLSVLIVSPCVTAPLIGALTYLSSTGNVWLGGAALFALGLGMGIPLIIAGTFEGKWLPKSGPWLQRIKTLFGVLLLAMAINLLERIVPGQIAMMLWAAFCIILAVYLGILSKAREADWRILWHGLSIILLIYGGALLIGALQGNTNPLQPLSFTLQTTNKSALNFQKIKSILDLQQVLITAKAQHKPVLVDFYADWCVACKTMDNYVFQNIEVQAALKHYIVVRADVTANDMQAKALEKYLSVIAPPTLIFYNADGQELTSARIIGEVNAAQFLQRLPKPGF